MTNPQITWACCAALLMLPTASGIAATEQNTAASDVDADAMAALDKMGAELRSHQNFDVKSDVSTEDVLDDGQKLQYVGTVEVQARRPNGFRISAVSDLKDRQIYYDGKSVTVFAPKLGYYATFPAQDTIAKTLDAANKKYGIELPLADLFSWGTDKSLAARVKSAFFVRPEHIDGQVCNHYAFRQERVDWQVWIAESGPALPCKIVITNTTDPAMPQYAAVLHWSFPASIPDNAFAFVPPTDARKIVIATLDGSKK